MADKRALPTMVRVNGFSTQAAPNDLAALFDTCGKVRRVTKNDTDNSVIIEFAHASGAKNAVRQFHGQVCDASMLVVELFTPAPRAQAESTHVNTVARTRPAPLQHTVAGVDHYQPLTIRPRTDLGIPQPPATARVNYNEHGHLPHLPRETLKSPHAIGAPNRHLERDAPYTAREQRGPVVPVAPIQHSPAMTELLLFEEFQQFKKLLAAATPRSPRASDHAHAHAPVPPPSHFRAEPEPRPAAMRERSVDHGTQRLRTLDYTAGRR